MPTSSRKPGVKKINLALQGGGAHGAFTWGVLDQILACRDLHISAISGTSAGAMNAVVLADGIMSGGPQGARQALRRFWRAVSQTASFNIIQRTPTDVLTGNWSVKHSPGYLFTDLWSRLASPYLMNPLNANPLLELLKRQVDFKRVRSCNRLKLFISATRVQNGQGKVFDRKQLTAEKVMASACLPNLFQAINIDGIDYWDGGFSGNPVLYPFAYRSDTRGVVIVQINPLRCRKTPTEARDILNRVNEITFNASLRNELRAIEFVSRLLDKGQLDAKRYKKMLIHIIADQDDLAGFDASTKMNPEWSFLQHLFKLGQKAAQRWIDTCLHQLGKTPTVDIPALLAGCGNE